MGQKYNNKIKYFIRDLNILLFVNDLVIVQHTPIYSGVERHGEDGEGGEGI